MPQPQSPPPETPSTISEPVASNAFQVTCPHCQNVVHIVPIQTAPTHAAQRSEVPTATAKQHPVIRMIRFLLAQRQIAAHPGNTLPSSSKPTASSTRRQRWLVLAAVGAMFLVVIALFVWESQHRPVLSHATDAVPAQPAVTDVATAEAAIRDTLTQYNAAETEAAALLSIEPLRPYLAPDGAMFTRRMQELAGRQRRNAPHRALLVRWGIGEIQITGSTATAITQETWSNQEIGEVAAKVATVRVTYTLRWDAATEAWLIMASEQRTI